MLLLHVHLCRHAACLPPAAFPLWQDFADELDVMPKITMVNNVIHNNQGYAVILVKPGDAAVEEQPAEPNAAGMFVPVLLLPSPHFTQRWGIC